MKKPDVIFVSSKQMSCDGNVKGPNNASGHPRVYFNMGDKDELACNYCGQVFKFLSDSPASDH